MARAGRSASAVMPTAVTVAASANRRRSVAAPSSTA